MTIGTTDVSFSKINQEIEAASPTTQISFGSSPSRLRYMGGAATGSISFSSFKNKSNTCEIVINTARSSTINVASLAASSGYANTYQKLLVTIQSGVVCYGSPGTFDYANASIYFDGTKLSGGANNQTYGIYLVNNGTLVGPGGSGGKGGNGLASVFGDEDGSPGSNGGPSVYVTRCTVNITNNGIMSGGAGGGAGGKSGEPSNYTGGGGGGGGAPYGIGGAGGMYEGPNYAPSGTTAGATSGGSGGGSSGGASNPGYSGGSQSAGSWSQNGGGITLTQYINNINAGIITDGYFGSGGNCSIRSLGVINWLVNGTRYGTVA